MVRHPNLANQNRVEIDGLDQSSQYFEKEKWRSMKHIQIRCETQHDMPKNRSQLNLTQGFVSPDINVENLDPSRPNSRAAHDQSPHLKEQFSRQAPRAKTCKRARPGANETSEMKRPQWISANCTSKLMEESCRRRTKIQELLQDPLGLRHNDKTRK